MSLDYTWTGLDYNYIRKENVMKIMKKTIGSLIITAMCCFFCIPVGAAETAESVDLKPYYDVVSAVSQKYGIEVEWTPSDTLCDLDEFKEHFESIVAETYRENLEAQEALAYADKKGYSI